MGELPIAWDPWPTVEIRLDAREALRGALAALRPDARDVLTLVVGEDLAVVDAARVLGFSGSRRPRPGVCCTRRGRRCVRTLGSQPFWTN
ncbi:hypothetical protein LWF15_20215 [Kineosporia rhizophila]|uniref:hypothetical protein n=1 Tax=Kineosporia rhizophila TaxID=84633 RepID=UPI001E35C621|nr:hypothetical protein [Kineosporia rhizophila]MCE0537822.1 hypothetical protein [Kineosporia rhizophila]